MSYHLALGDRAYSSWSLRGWLLFESFGIPVQTRFARLDTEDFATLLADYAPSRTVPALRLPEGHVIWDSLAIAETLHERHPDAGIWPREARRRALARTLAAEMHAGFVALRQQCPMNLRVSYADYVPSPAVLAELARLQTLWAWALQQSGGPWLAGDWSAADVYYAPVASRIASYGLPVDEPAGAYVAAILARPEFRRWRAMALVDGPDQPRLARPELTRRVWPGPAPIPAVAVDSGHATNAACPYSGRPITDLARIDGRIYGFCNPFCRDKTVADPAAWPQFVALLDGARS